jgi:hypothetical protein
MDVPLKFVLPLLLAAALPAGLAVQRMLPAAPPNVTPAPVRVAHVPAPEPVHYQDDAAQMRLADEAIAEQRARLAAAQAERDRAELELALMRDQRRGTDPSHAEGERRDHAVAVRERMKVESARANCISAGWHCARP